MRRKNDGKRPLDFIEVQMKRAERRRLAAECHAGRMTWEAFDLRMAEMFPDYKIPTRDERGHIVHD